MVHRALSFALAFLVACVALTVHAEERAAEAVMADEVWARATPPNAVNGVAYLTLHNRAERDYRLVAASSPVAGRVELHHHTDEDGMARMRRVDGVDLKAGAELKFMPGGLHIMLMDLKGALAAGDTFPLQLEFADGSRLELEVVVRRHGARERHDHNGGQRHRGHRH